MKDIAISIASKIFEFFVEGIVNWIWFAFNWEDNICKLREEVDLLIDAEGSVNRRVEEATRRSGEEIEPGVDKWLKKVQKAIEVSEKVLGDEDRAKRRFFMGLVPDFKMRFKLSRDAAEQTQACFKLRGEGNFDRVSCYKPPEQIISVKDYEAFESRTEVLEAIMEALMDSDVNLIGVYGMGGVGKTTFVRKVAEQVKKERIFNKVVLAAVTQYPDLEKIQREIAETLDFQFGNVETVRGRAYRLCERLKEEEKLLLILDDIWEKINLEDLGIPYGNDHKGCKILMTSRNQNVLSCQMNTQKDFGLQVLEDGEAWNLFEKRVGDALRDPDLQSIARQVANQCAGLPILLLAVAQALKNRKLPAWKDALEQLKRFDEDDIDKQVFSALELSYNYLRGKEIKSLFLFFAQFNPNSIYMPELLMKTLGMGILKRNNTLEEVRNRLHALLDDLKTSCLLEEHNNIEVKMHDVVHSFAVSIAFRDHHVFRVKADATLTEWPNKTVFEKCTAICLLDCKFPQLPEVLECPKLESFIVQSEDSSLIIPDNLFRRLKKLKVLAVGDVHFSSLPSSLKFLVNLRSLSFYRCHLKDMAVIGELKKLQVLCLKGSRIIQLPQEIAQLTNLRLLDVSHCRGLEVIPPNVLSCLTQLEELRIENSFVQWDSKGLNCQGSNANLAELKLLQKLSTLVIHITDAKMLPKDLFPGNLERFWVCIGDGWEWPHKYETSRTLKLKLNTSIHLEEGIKSLMGRADDLHLHDLVGLKSILFELDAQGFLQMKHLHVQNSLEIQYVINSMRIGPRDAFPRLESLFLINLNGLEKIYHGQLTALSFSKLRKLEVRNCGKIRNLFSLAMAKGLLQLEGIKVTDCESMEEIVAEDSELDSSYDELIQLTCLRKLTLEYLPRFTSFCIQLKLTSTSQMSQNFLALSSEIVSESELGNPVPLFNDKVVFPNLEALKLTSIKVGDIWYCQFAMSSYVKRLTTLEVTGCNNLKYVFRPSVIGSLAQLKILEIYDCECMEEIILAKEVEGAEMIRKVLFHKLAWLKLKNLPKLRRFCCGDLIECHSLKEVLIENCPELKTFISNFSSVDVEAKSENEITNSTLFDEKVAFPNLEYLMILYMPALKMIWNSELRTDSFSKLRHLTVKYCKDLLKIFPPETLRRFQNLEDLTVKYCDSLEEVFDLINAKETHTVAAMQLRNLRLWNLPNLKCVWNQDPREMFNFQNIRTVEAGDCERLETLFPTSIALSLPQLEELCIYKGKLMKEIVAKEEGVEEAPMFVFPRLKSLELEFNEELRSFYPGMHILECQMIERLNVYHCHKLQTFASEPHHPEETHAQNQQLHFPLFSSRKVISKLKMLSLNSEDVTMICEDLFPTNFFDTIKDLQVSCFHDENKLVDFPFDLLHKFKNVETLCARYCYCKEIFPSGLVSKEKYASTLGQIKDLTLWNLPKLRHIWNLESPSNEVQVPLNLITLLVKNCELLISLAPSYVSFQTLTTLRVRWCPELINLVTSSTAKTLVQLTQMEVIDCVKVKQIVANEGDEAENEIVFSKLERLTLHELQNVTSFCSGICTIKFPSLKEVIVEKCPRMKFFSQGPLSTPKLHAVLLTEAKDKWRWKGDLNTTIKQVYADMNAQEFADEREN